MFGQNAKLKKRIAELEEELLRCQEMRNDFEFDLIRAREGMDEQTNEFFRQHPVYVAPEQSADAGAAGAVAKKPRSKKV